MESARRWRWLRKAVRWKYSWIALIVATIAALHFASAAYQHGFVFDESYYVVEARGIMAGWGPLHLEQPPLGKLFIISGMRLFGDNPLGWRFFPVIFGIVAIVLFYFICSSLKMPRRAQLFATVLLAFENLTFVESGVAMLDVFSLALMLGAFLLYLKGRHLWAGCSLGLSFLAKFIGGLGGVVILLDWAFSWLRERLHAHSTSSPVRTGGWPLTTGVARRFRPVVALGIATVVCVLALYPVLHYALSYSFTNPFTLLRTAFHLTSTVTFSVAHDYNAAAPAAWVLRMGGIFYTYMPQYIATVTPTIWVLIVPSVLYMLYKAIKGDEAALFGLAWFAGTYLVWIPAVMITDRLTYIYYMLPVVGSICIGIGLGMNDVIEMGKVQHRQILRRLAPAAVYGYLAVDLAFFVILCPLFWPMLKWFPLGK